MRSWFAILLVSGATAFVVGCPSKKGDPGVVAAPPSASTATVDPRVKVEVFAVRRSATSETSIEVATKLSYTLGKCETDKLLQPPWDAGERRRMVLFRVKDVSLVTGGAKVVARDGKESADDSLGNEGGEHAIVIDCIDGIPDSAPFPFFFTFDVPPGFDTKLAKLVLEGTSVPLPPIAAP